MPERGNQNAFMTIMLAIIILSGSFLFIRSSMNRTALEPDVSITENELIIDGMYGRAYPISTITAVDLVEGIPILGRKINGAGLTGRKAHRGIYQVEGLGECRVFLFGDEGLYIQLTTDSEKVLIMYREKEDTMQLYDEIHTKLFEA